MRGTFPIPGHVPLSAFKSTPPTGVACGSRATVELVDSQERLCDATITVLSWFALIVGRTAMS
eukprot:6409092-Amphidinium_carterae.1